MRDLIIWNDTQVLDIFFIPWCGKLQAWKNGRHVKSDMYL